MLDFLTKVNDFLEQVPDNTLNFFNSFFKSGEELVQSKVDLVCAWVSWQVNITIERLRQRVLKALWQHYNKYLILLKAGSIIQDFVTDPIGTIGRFANEFLKPFKKVKEFIEVLVKEIPRLAMNLARIAESLPPTPPSPDINFNAFDIKVNTISMKEIMAGIDNLPSPEEMFPEPTRPFGKKTFDASFQNAKATTAADQIVYKLKK